ncbi:hypothetical protein BaRGS_00023051 [Batillaria attramentaria]|uniref:Uncharacterized protein n=1 Tax=Batillaria attramentaria TaxID=370345 RepID=A0ABD0KFI5_9CAEN
MPFGSFETLKGKVLQPSKDAANLAKISLHRKLPDILSKSLINLHPFPSLLGERTPEACCCCNPNWAMPACSCVKNPPCLCGMCCWSYVYRPGNVRSLQMMNSSEFAGNRSLAD